MKSCLLALCTRSSSLFLSLPVNDEVHYWRVLYSKRYGRKCHEHAHLLPQCSRLALTSKRHCQRSSQLRNFFSQQHESAQCARKVFLREPILSQKKQLVFFSCAPWDLANGVSMDKGHVAEHSASHDTFCWLLCLMCKPVKLLLCVQRS